MSGVVGVSREPESGSSSALLLVAIGSLGITTQLILLRELMAAYGGNELSAGVTVAAWILCEAFGARLAGRLRSSPHSSPLPALSILFSLTAVPAAVLARPVLGILPGETLSIPLLLLATFAVVFLPAASHGALFVTAAAHRTQGIGSAYVWEGIGTALAGLVCFALLSRLPSLAIVALFSIPLAAALFFSRPSSLGPLLFSAVAIAALAKALPIERWAWATAWRGQKVTAVTDSPYGKTVLLERAGQQLILYDGLPVLSVPPTRIERIEELSLLPVLYHPAPRRVLVLGSDLTIPFALAGFRPDINVTTVQLDAVLARTCLAAVSGQPSFALPRLSLVISDPIVFLRATRDSFDCIILTDAAPSGLGASRLFSSGFYRLCRSRIAAGGLLATAGPGDPTALSPDAARILSTRVRTLKTTFRHVLPVAADFPLLFESENLLGVSAESLTSRLAMLAQTPKLLDSTYMAGLLDHFRQEALSSALEPEARSARTGVSSVALPRELFLNMVRENRLASPAFGTLYGRLGAVAPRLLLLLGVMLLVAGIVGAFCGGHAFNRGFAILTSGFSGAAVSSLLLFAWQARFGSIFSGVALLVAAFMLGTVFGGILGTRRFSLHPSSRLLHPFLLSDLVLAACAAAVMALIRVGPTGAFLVANSLAGACLGFQFAVAGFIAPRWPQRPLSDGASFTASSPGSLARRAGVLASLDLVGGSLGGILTALVFVPVFGIGAAALCAGAVKLASALAQLVPGRPASPP